MKKRAVLLHLCVCCLLAGLSAAAEGAPSLEGLFWGRSWAGMDKFYASMSAPTPRDHALMANGLRIRGKWDEAVTILEGNASSFPDSIRPYVNMTLLLGYEKQKRTPEALSLVEKLWKNSPDELKYYVASAQYRLLQNSPPAKQQGALDRMLRTAGTRERESFVLSRMIKLPGDRTEQALKLLNLQASNKAAAELLFKRPKPWPASISLALGIYAHLVKDDATAVSLLAAIPPSGTGGRKAAYYRAWSLYRQKRYAEALNLWGPLVLKGNAYAEASVRRIGAMVDERGAEKEKNACLELLKKTVEGRKGKVQARAMLVLSKFVDEAEKEKLETRLLQAYPDTAYAFEVLWRRGWERWNAGDAAESERCWKTAYAPGVDSARKARILYWLAEAQKAVGKPKEAEDTLNLLARNHPLSFYTFTARPDAVAILEGSNPAFKSKPTELEHWGFVYYAKLKLERRGASAKELYRALSLSRWLGSSETYALARLFTGHFTEGAKLYRDDLEALYPRPFRKEVEAACKTYKVEDLLVWSVMRQESAFKPRATSWAGASGLMQLMPATAKGEAKRIGLKQYDIYAAEDNILMGVAHLAWLNKSFARQDWIMAAYNAGSGNARKWLAGDNSTMTPERWIEEIRFNETCDYVQKVSGNLAVYRMLYAKKDATSDDVFIEGLNDDEAESNDEVTVD